MKDKSKLWIRCGILGAVSAIAAVFSPSAALAQTSYYWNGGAGSWDTTSTIWSSTSGGGGTLTWANGTNSVAYIGYIGTGGAYSAPAAINLTSPIVANSLVFGVPAGHAS